MENIQIFTSQKEFEYRLSQISSISLKKKFCKSTLQKLHITQKIGYRTTDIYGLECIEIMRNEIIRICKDKDLWNDSITFTPPKKQRMDNKSTNNNDHNKNHHHQSLPSTNTVRTSSNVRFKDHIKRLQGGHNVADLELT